jgi:hypothetical protein
MAAAFTLNRLDDDRRRRRRHRGLERRDVAGRHEGHTGNERLERLAVMRVGGHRERPHRAAREAVFEGDELGAAAYALGEPVAAGELEAGLHGLGATVAEERAWQAGERRQPRRHLTLERVVVEVRRVQQRRGLLGDGARQSRVSVPEYRHANARHEVEIAAAVDVLDAAALAAYEHHRLPLVGLQHVLGFERLNRGCGRRHGRGRGHRRPY